jgi:G:T-mismatch repair DNA endonuclease (very short patch repair protein)
MKSTSSTLKKTKYRNNFESSVAKFLRRQGTRFQYEERKIPYIVAGHYTPDFTVHTPTGIIFVETKGFLRPEDKRKLVAVKRCNPKLDIRIVFYERRVKQIKWAEKVGFKWAIGTIPKEWIQGL